MTVAAPAKVVTADALVVGDSRRTLAEELRLALADDIVRGMLRARPGTSESDRLDFVTRWDSVGSRETISFWRD